MSVVQERQMGTANMWRFSGVAVNVVGALHSDLVVKELFP